MGWSITELNKLEKELEKEVSTWVQELSSREGVAVEPKKMFNDILGMLDEISELPDHLRLLKLKELTRSITGSPSTF